MSSPRVVVVGLGPSGVDHLLPAALEALRGASHRFVRTARHPAVAELEAAGISLQPFDSVYDEAADLDSAYSSISSTLLDAARQTAEDAYVAYAVPGNPLVAERSVVLLLEAKHRGDVVVDVVPGLSFADLAWTRLGIDPLEHGARIVDARAITPDDVNGRMLIAQCDNRLILSDVKLALLEEVEPTTPVTVLARLGGPDESVTTMTAAELDRVVTPDHLTTVFVDATASAGPSAAAREVVRLLRLARRLRDPGGCPWDAEQTHHSLARYLLEESYEVVEAIDALPANVPDVSRPDPSTATAYAALEDELGDLLYEVVFQALIAEETGNFTMADIARGIHDKLVRRHPHVFGDVVVADAGDVVRNWEQIKLEEKGTRSLVAGITPGLPSLLYTAKLFRKAESIGLDPGRREEAIERADRALDQLRASEPVLPGAIAQLLAGVVMLSLAGGIDPETTLRGWAARYRERFRAMEHLADARGMDLGALDPPAVAALWLEAASTLSSR